MCSRSNLRWHVLLIVTLLYASTQKSISATGNGISNNEIINAVQQYECFREFWGAPDKRGQSVTISFNKKGDTAYVRMTGLETSQQLSRILNFLTIVAREGRSVVTENAGFDPSLANTPEFRKDLQSFSAGMVHDINIRFLETCPTPSPTDTPLKQKMLHKLEDSVSQELSGFNMHAGTHYARRLKIVIGDFDTDYPGTNVLVYGTNVILQVRLGTNLIPGDHSGLYPVQLVNDPAEAKSLKIKILEHGIIRQIELIP